MTQVDVLRRRLAAIDRAEKAAVRLVPRRQRGTTRFGRFGDITQQPTTWAAMAGGLALAGGERGKRAALRGSVCFGAAAVVANLAIKPIVARTRPPGSGKGRPGPITSSFPSGHTATDLAFSLGVAQEIPVLFLPMTAGTLAAHWSMIRSRGHFPSDVLAGGAVGVAVALVAWKLWPPGERAAGDEEGRTSGRAERHDAVGTKDYP